MRAGSGGLERPRARRAAGQAVAQLREVGVRGVLTYSDIDCRLHAVSFPELEPAEAPPFEMCQPVTSSGGLGPWTATSSGPGLGYGSFRWCSPARSSRAPILGGPAGAEAGFRAVQAVSLDDGPLPRARGLASGRVTACSRLPDGPRAEFVQLMPVGRRCPGDPAQPARWLLRGSGPRPEAFGCSPATGAPSTSPRAYLGCVGGHVVARRPLDSPRARATASGRLRASARGPVIRVPLGGP